MRGPAVVGLLSAFVVGCVLSPIDPSGRRCDERDRCLEGWQCDLATRSCVLEGGRDGGPGPDAPGLDAAAFDVGTLDVGTLDVSTFDAALDARTPPPDSANLDAGPVDARVADDAAAPSCVPACEPGVERCEATGCVLVEDSTLTPVATPVVVTLGPAFYELSSEIDLDFATLTTLEGQPIDVIDVVRVPPRAGGVPYDLCRFDNLPMRPPERPLVIASTGGRVTCRLGIVTGGSHWVLTGRHDPALGIGDATAPGHDLGYADTRGRYGWEFLATLSVTSSAPSVPRIEIDHVEVSGREATGAAQLDIVANQPIVAWVHDSYFHDGPADGVRFSGAAPTRAILTRTRILREAEGCLVGTDLDAGSLLRNDVLAACGIGVRAIGTQFWTDAAITLEAREGLVRVEDLVVAGAHATALNLIDAGDASRGEVTFALSDLVVDGVANHPILLRSRGPSSSELDAVLIGQRLRFAVARWTWDAVEVSATLPMEPPLISTTVSSPSRMELTDVHWDPGVYTRAVPLGYGSAMRSDTDPLDVEGAVFVDFMAGVEPGQIEHWHAQYIRPDPDGGPLDPRDRSFDAMQVVTYLGRLYRATRATVASDVPGASSAWMLLAPQPSDDVGLATSSSYEAWGVGL